MPCWKIPYSDLTVQKLFPGYFTANNMWRKCIVITVFVSEMITICSVTMLFLFLPPVQLLIYEFYFFYYLITYCHLSKSVHQYNFFPSFLCSNTYDHSLTLDSHCYSKLWYICIWYRGWQRILFKWNIRRIQGSVMWNESKDCIVSWERNGGKKMEGKGCRWGGFVTRSCFII